MALHIAVGALVLTSLALAISLARAWREVRWTQAAMLKMAGVQHWQMQHWPEEATDNDDVTG